MDSAQINYNEACEHGLVIMSEKSIYDQHSPLTSSQDWQVCDSIVSNRTMLVWQSGERGQKFPNLCDVIYKCSLNKHFERTNWLKIVVKE